LNMKAYIAVWLFPLIIATNCINKEKNNEGEIFDLCSIYPCVQGGIIRGDTTKRALAIVFTGGDYADGGEHIKKVLKDQKVLSSFFFTGDFYRNNSLSEIINILKADGHYLGAHSDKHLLYCGWANRDSLLVTKGEFMADVNANYEEMERFGISKPEAKYFMPPYEWYNDSISKWTREAGLQLINFTPGTWSNADYTTPEMNNYKSSEAIFQSIMDFEKSSSCGLNGFILLIHIGTAPERADKFYNMLDELIIWLKNRGYQMVRIDELLAHQ
jgi:peptidoglycan/xylan/chitin deacetylase (PgdA/CDA1 family)